MSDPNLNKIVDANIKNIKQGILGTTITHASSYLDYIYGYYNRDKRKQELDNFIYEFLSSLRQKINDPLGQKKIK